MLFIVYKSVVTGEICTKPIGKIENVCYHNIIPKKGDVYKRQDLKVKKKYVQIA